MYKWKKNGTAELVELSCDSRLSSYSTLSKPGMMSSARWALLVFHVHKQYSELLKAKGERLGRQNSEKEQLLQEMEALETRQHRKAVAISSLKNDIYTHRQVIDLRLREQRDNHCKTQEHEVALTAAATELAKLRERVSRLAADSNGNMKKINQVETRLLRQRSTRESLEYQRGLSARHGQVGPTGGRLGGKSVEAKGVKRRRLSSLPSLEDEILSLSPAVADRAQEKRELQELCVQVAAPAASCAAPRLSHSVQKIDIEQGADSEQTADALLEEALEGSLVPAMGQLKSLSCQQESPPLAIEALDSLSSDSDEAEMQLFDCMQTADVVESVGGSICAATDDQRENPSLSCRTTMSELRAATTTPFLPSSYPSSQLLTKSFPTDDSSVCGMVAANRFDTTSPSSSSFASSSARQYYCFAVKHDSRLNCEKVYVANTRCCTEEQLHKFYRKQLRNRDTVLHSNVSTIKQLKDDLRQLARREADDNDKLKELEDRRAVASEQLTMLLQDNTQTSQILAAQERALKDYRDRTEVLLQKERFYRTEASADKDLLISLFNDLKRIRRQGN